MTADRRAAWALAAALSVAGLTAGAALPEAAQAQAQAAKARPKLRPKQLFPYWENYLRIPAAERTRFAPAYIVTSGGKPMTDFGLFAIDGARRAPIAIAADGRMTPPPAEFFRSKTAILDAPAATGRKFDIQMELVATAAPAREMQAAPLTATIAQSNAGIRKAAGLLGIAAPRMAQVVFVDAGSGEAVDAQGRRTPLPLGAGGSPYFQPASMPNAQRLVLARAPSKILIGTAPKAKGRS